MARTGAIWSSPSLRVADRWRRIEQSPLKGIQMKNVQITELELVQIEELEGKIAPSSEAGFLASSQPCNAAGGLYRLHYPTNVLSTHSDILFNFCPTSVPPTGSAD
jgi:hypothetical protein